MNETKLLQIINFQKIINQQLYIRRRDFDNFNIRSITFPVSKLFIRVGYETMMWQRWFKAHYKHTRQRERKRSGLFDKSGLQGRTKTKFRMIVLHIVEYSF